MYKYTAVIVEPRQHKALSFVLKNFLSNLSNDWGIMIWHGTNNYDYLMNILNNNLSEYKNRIIELVNLGVDNLTIDAYNSLCLNRNFYEKIPTETFMIFQTDSIINSNNKDLINNFLDYDYIGAPWRNGYVGNGGLSIRKKSKMLYILDNIPYTGGNEDGYFSFALKNHNFNIAPYDVALTFSIETVYSPIFFGIHSPWKSLTCDEMESLKKLCPDVEKLIELNK